MRKVFYALGIVLTIISCKKETPIDYAIVSGKIQNNNAQELIFATNMGVAKDTLTIKADGSFVDTLKVQEGRYILYDGKNRVPLYIDITNDINIAYDLKDYDNTLSYSGAGSEINNYLLSKGKKTIELRGERVAFYQLDEAAYISKNLEIKTALEDMIASADGISETFKAKELRNINYEYLSKLNKYERFHAYHTKNPDFKVSEGFLDPVENLDYTNEEDFLFSADYKSMLTSHVANKANALAKSDTLIKTDIAFLKTASEIPNETIRNSLLFSKSKFGITITEDLESYYNTFISASTNEEQNKEITLSYNKLKVLNPGQPSPKFINYENYEGETTSLDDLTGKYVYIDVWATWCAPCKAEIPFLKDIEKEYHEKNIAFVSVSVDKSKDYDKWRKMVKKEELGGIQLFADKNFESDFIKNYMIQGIPRFILIDPQGNIVSANAPRPSNSKLKDLFSELNI